MAALFSRAPITQETDEETILRASESMAKAGNVSQAIKFLENAIALRKSSGPLYIALAGYYRGAGDQQKADQLESKGRALAKE